MNLRIHLFAVAALLLFCLVDSSIENSPASSAKVGSSSLKALDDLYIDDEGDDEIQLGDEASGSGPLTKPTRVEEDEDEDEEEEEEEDEEDEDSSSPVVVVEEPKKEMKPIVTTKEDDVVVPPKVSPVAAPPSRVNPVVDIDDDDEDDDDFEVQGSGEGSGATGRVPSGSSSSSGTDDEEEEDYDDTEEVDSIDINSVITEPEPKVPPKPERKPEVVVVAPPTTPVKPSKESDNVGPSPPPPPTVTQAPPAPPVEVITTTTTSHPVVPVEDVHIDHKSEDRQASFFAQPGILAAVIGGAVVGLLCAILLVMFIVYRMRKKDEGSYVLDEPKRSSPSSHPYNKNSREFYA